MKLGMYNQIAGMPTHANPCGAETTRGGAAILKMGGTKHDSRAERAKKIFLYPPLFQMWRYKQANVTFEYIKICCLVVAYIMQISKRDNFTFQQWQVKLDGCIVLNGRNAVFARIDPLYATVSLGPPESWTQTLSRSLLNILQGSLGDTPTDRPTDHATRSFTIGGIYYVLKERKAI